MNWFQKLLPSKIRTRVQSKSVPEGLWSKCQDCNAFLFHADLEKNLGVCSECGYHSRITARDRLRWFLDSDMISKELYSDLEPVDFLKFKDSKKYKDRLLQSQKETGERDALIAMQGYLKGLEIIAVSFDFRFIGGSMGAVVGAKFVSAVHDALKQQKPLVCFATSGGARMQESLIALMQMSKTSAALARFREAGLPYLVVLSDPCTGGVSASLAMLGDVIIAEPRALIGFAGPKVIEQTVREILPEGFQRSEFLLEKGAVDMIVDRRNLRSKIHNILIKLLRKN